MPGPNTAWKAQLAVALAAVAGFVDVVGYLTLHHLFTAHMTGNTSKLGVALGHGDLSAALPLAVVPWLFMGGIAAGTLLVDAGRRWLALALQAALVAGFMGFASTVLRHGTVPGHTLAGFYPLAALATVALGLQTAALTEIQGATVRTSYISGVLTHLAQAAVRRLSGRGGGRGRPLRLLACVCLAYLGGATLGSYTLGRLSIWCLALPLGLLVVAAALDRLSRDGGRDAVSRRDPAGMT
jgi:uncharacterized membrane protein YoaK (UPF0700 family)